jgi:hypothetical protein
MFERHDQKLVVFAFIAVFVCYAHNLGFGLIYKTDDTQYMFERHDQKLAILTLLGHFCELLSAVLGFQGDLQGL